MAEVVGVEQAEFDAAFAESAALRAANDGPTARPTAEPSPAPSKREVEAKPEAAAPAPAPRATEHDTLSGQLAEALHRERSSANRISAFAKENNQLKQSIADMQRQISDLMAVSAKSPASAATSAKSDVLKEAPDLEAAVQARIAEAIAPYKEALSKHSARLDDVDDRATLAAESIQPLSQAEHQRKLRSVMTQLDEAFSTEWRKDIKQAPFVQWLNRQDKVIQDRYADADTFDTSSTVLRMYYADAGLQRRPAPPATRSEPPTSSAQRLRNSATLPPSSVSRPSAKADDFDSAFEEFANARRARKLKVNSNAQYLR